MKRTAHYVILLLIFALLPAGVLSAQSEEAVPPEGAFRHDGLFLRFQTGLGLGRMVEKDVNGSDIIMSGTSGVFRFQLGGALFENFIIYGELGGFNLTDPSLKGEEGYITATADTDITLSISDLGLGVCYYFMPINIYISASVTLSRDRLEIDDKKGSTSLGQGACVSVGKEWWVSENWGLGVSVFAYVSRMHARESGAFTGRYTVYNMVTGLAFSATYN